MKKDKIICQGGLYGQTLQKSGVGLENVSGISQIPIADA